MNIITVIGNGFDRHLGYKTGYTDFFKWLFEDREKTTKNIYVEIEEPVNFSYIVNKDNIRTQKMAGEILHNFKHDNFYYKDISRINDWWSLYFYEKKNELPNENWSSIEEKIENILKKSESENLIKNVRLWNWRYYDLKKEGNPLSFYDYIRIKNEIFPKKGENVFEYLLSELKKFEAKFIEYMEEQLSKSDYTFEADKLLSILKSFAQNDCNKRLERKSEKVNIQWEDYILNFNTILSFNYTGDFINVHGTIEEKDIIFGIDEKTEVVDGAEIFKKTYRKLFLKQPSEELPDDCDYILFYGHSLAPADYSYFLNLFEIYDIYKSGVKLLFFVNDKIYDYNWYNQKELAKNVDAVYKLIHKAGKDFLGDLKGDNLLHKMQVENRIQVVKMSEVSGFMDKEEIAPTSTEEKKVLVPI
ncbi:MAG: bacteriophage abortive infection AbiH family protein [Oscillospiraceae bacterium]|jgi:hypothetical protein|nr:bacteriophage abortive infection AbiH family protein [Oscillospiraceae bacterium]